MERILGYLIGGIVALATLAGVLALIGGALLGGIAVGLTFPAAAPMTTGALIVVLILAYVAYRRAKRRE